MTDTKTRPGRASPPGTIDLHADNATTVSVRTPAVDIEHMPVTDDPRHWSNFRKNVVLALVSGGSMIAGFSANIQNPAIEDMEVDLPATSSQISLSISLFILLQGAVPLVWSAISEVKGRRFVYLISLLISVAGSIVVALSPTIQLVIGFRCLQAIGSSAVMALGAATLADVFEPRERGTKMGIYYMAPLMGPSLGPIFGGVLTSAFGWRAVFWFLVIAAGSSFLGFLLFFKDTFRRERSMVYQNVLRHRLREKALHVAHHDAHHAAHGKAPEPFHPEKKHASSEDVEKGISRAPTAEDLAKDEISNIKVGIKDINPIRPVWKVLRRKNNVVTLLSSGIIFAFSFVVSYTGSRTLGSAYHYTPLKIGFTLLSFGIGSLVGSIFGGRFSDYQLAKLVAKNGGRSYPEMRLRSTLHGLWLFPPFVVGLGWVSNYRLHVAVLCVFFFLTGVLSVWVYSSTLAYIVDSNVGRSSTAVAVNSCFRGLAAFIWTELAVPMQDHLGDGWMYTIVAGLMAIGSLLTLLVMKKGEAWREQAEAREAATGLPPTAINTPVGERSLSPTPHHQLAARSAGPGH